MYLPYIDFSLLSYVFAFRFVIEMPIKLRIKKQGNPINSPPNIFGAKYRCRLFN
jgi:hypothetical protein